MIEKSLREKKANPGSCERWLVIDGRISGLSEPDRPLDLRKKLSFLVFVSKPCTRSLWMKLADLSIVIINLIVNLPFLYHNPETAGDSH
jgi:hypothetical protein